MSETAFKAIKRKIKQEWKFHAKIHKSLEEIASEINPQVRGWINYYGKFYGSSMRKLKNQIDGNLARWSRRKHKNLRGHKWRSHGWLLRVRKKAPKMFVHWYLGKAY